MGILYKHNGDLKVYAKCMHNFDLWEMILTDIYTLRQAKHAPMHEMYALLDACNFDHACITLIYEGCFEPYACLNLGLNLIHAWHTPLHT